MRPLGFAVAGFVVLTTLGCQEEIRSYQVPKPEPAAEAPSAGKVPVRMLVAMVPHGKDTWFFKLTGPAETVAQQHDTFNKFLQSVRFTRQGDKPLEWKVPDGWRAEANSGKASAMVQRYATFHVGPADQAGELTVTPLGQQVGSLLANVNRWRGQIGLKPIAEAELTKVSTDVTVDNEAATLIDMSGSGTLKAAKGMLANHPPIPANRGAGALAPVPPVKYVAPPGWKEAPAGGMRVASFTIEEGSSKGEVSVIPLSGGSGSVLENVNRWRGQINLAPTTAEALAKEMQEIQVAGGPAYYVDLLGTTSKDGPQRTLAVIVPRGGQTWFIKMWGPPELIHRQKGAFEAFVRSLEFAGATGANRG